MGLVQGQRPVGNTNRGFVQKEQVNANNKGIRILRGGNILPNKYIFKDDDVFVSEEFVNANTILKRTASLLLL